MNDDRASHPAPGPRGRAAAAAAWGLADVPAYLADLEGEIEVWRAAYTSAAVTEIASLRSALSGPQVG